MSAAHDARALVAIGRLTSLDRDSGAPFASLVAHVDGAGQPLLLLSGLAEPPQPPRRRAVHHRRRRSPALHGPAPRHLGRHPHRPTGDDAARAEERFAAVHPEASVWVTLPDFAPARLAVQQIRWVGGFARAVTVAPADSLK
ncbi:MAG: hypothetical protein AMXMBFR34_45780 [Myxococcaceae bacterium]